jgi:hypothetical protein
MSDGARVKWEIEAEYLQACSCDYGCPCEFQAPPTKGFCEGMGGWRISRGRFGDVRLDGLGFGFVARWPGALHEGNGTAVLFFDERASAAQRDALLTIASGRAGGMPFEIVATTFSKVLPPQFVPMQFHFNGRNSRVQLGETVIVSVEPIKNPVTGRLEAARIEHETGFIFQSAEVVAAKDYRIEAGELKLTSPGKAGFVARVKYSN